jgi:uncharacterized protein (DUF885 family)
MKSTSRWLLLVACCLQSAISAAAGPASSGDEIFARLEREYVVFFLGQNPVVATYLGGSALDESLADVDSRLRDHSAAALKREDARLAELQRRFKALDAGTLSPRRRIDRDVALAQIAFLLRQHGTRRHQERALDSYMDEPFRGVDWHMQGFEERAGGHYGTDADWRRLIARLRVVPAYLQTAREQLLAGLRSANTPDWRVLRASGLDAAAANAEYFGNTLPAIGAERIGGANREALLKELNTAAAAAGRAYQDFRGFVVATFFDDASREEAAALKAPFRADHYAFGETEYDWAIRNNLQLDVSAELLFDESWPVVEATRAELVALARQIAAAHGWSMSADGDGIVRAVFAELTKDAPRSDDEVLEWFRGTGARLVAYARRTGLFDVPADYRLNVIETPPPLRTSMEDAAYYPAPPFKGTGVGNFFVTPTGNDPPALARRNRASLADLAAHEGFPGHDWHYKVMTQYRDSISLVRWLTPGAVEDSSSMWQDSMAAEGWALYAEALMAEPQPGAPQGFYTPEERLYQLQGRLYRDLRVRIDTGIHTGRMSFDEAVDLFSEIVDFLPGSCRAHAGIKDDAKRVSCAAAWGAIYRYSRWPTQAITYRLGKEQILALRAEAERRLGARFDARRFHLEFMKQGTVPAGYFKDELLRAVATAPGG